jgi:hypothetical protein
LPAARPGKILGLRSVVVAAFRARRLITGLAPMSGVMMAVIMKAVIVMVVPVAVMRVWVLMVTTMVMIMVMVMVMIIVRVRAGVFDLMSRHLEQAHVAGEREGQGGWRRSPAQPPFCRESSSFDPRESQADHDDEQVACDLDVARRHAHRLGGIRHVLDASPAS